MMAAETDESTAASMAPKLAVKSVIMKDGKTVATMVE